MADVSHTPGPWVVCLGDDFSNPGIDGPNGEPVVWWTSHKDTEGIPNHHDAHLIAAAPDLLKALEMAQLWLDIDGRHDMQAINAAIAKAKGNV